MPTRISEFGNAITIVFAAAALSVTALAQTTGGTAASCPAPASALLSMNLEQVINPGNVLATQGPPLPIGVVNGTQEIHSVFVFDPQSMTIHSTTFLAPKGAPIPTNPATITAANTLQLATARVDRILSGTNPGPSLVIMGTAINSPAGGFPSSVGTPWILTMGYSTGLGFSYFNVVNNFALVVAGQVIAWSPTATGTLTLGYPPAGTVVPYCAGS